jgi:hypothetical protein
VVHGMTSVGGHEFLLDSGSPFDHYSTSSESLHHPDWVMPERWIVVHSGAAGGQAVG